MKYSTSLLLLLVFIFSSNMSFSSDSDLVGVWADTYGNYYDFQKDGAFYGYNMVGEEKFIGAIGTYRVVKQSLIINIKESQNDKINPGDMPEIQYEIKNGLLIFIESGQEVNRLKKVK
jgi:hypothetical protein